MEQEICLGQFEVRGRAQMAEQGGFIELQGCGAVLFP
jgi:hypothetical protein